VTPPTTADQRPTTPDRLPTTPGALPPTPGALPPTPVAQPGTARQSASPDYPAGGRRISRAPVVVLIAGLALAFGLVLLGARLAATPAPVPDLSRPGTADAPRDVNVLLHDYAFSPRTVYLVADETVHFHIVNAGLVDHEFVLGDDDVQRAWAAADAAATPPAAFATAPPASVAPDIGRRGVRVFLRPGESASVLYQVPRNSALELMCHLPGHLERGMIAGVDVRQP
jgi:uncharacterized cupredoxin-like copper-binding protein